MVTSPITSQEAAQRISVVPGMRPRRFSALSRQLSRSWCKQLLVLAADGLALGVASGFLSTWLPAIAAPSPRLAWLGGFAGLLYVLGGYRSFDLRRPEKELELVCRAAGWSLSGLLCFELLCTGSVRLGFLPVWAGTLAALAFGRFALRALYGTLWRHGVGRQKLLLAGPGQGLEELRQLLAIQRANGYELLPATAEPLREGTAGATWRLSAERMQDCLAMAAAHNADLLLIAMPASRAALEVLSFIRPARQAGLEIEIKCAPPRLAGFTWEYNTITGGWRLSGRSSRALQRAAKALLDRTIGLVGSVTTLLLLPWVALLVWREDGWPLFYWREYVGCDGEVHYYPKFRTMVRDADRILEEDQDLKKKFESTCKLRQDPRVLRAGRVLRKYSLDEFPQFFSVLAGQLTFVGPRTISRQERARYGELLPRLLSVKPGLTGYWQVMGRQTTSYAERVRMDMFYIEHWSIWLDLTIIAKTFGEVLRARGAF
jgi:lipopolysaccharide/colanic/teichoic acid biosynthesis glycosyltransferase